jgi:hypothetical protein
MRMKRPATINIGIDLDAGVIAGFSVAGSRAPAPTLICDDARAFLLERTWTGRELVYCDPPYLMTVRSSHRRLYRYELEGSDEHYRLLNLLRSLPCMVQISGYRSDLYAAQLCGWRSISYQGWTRGGAREEWLWMNYPQPAILHDHSFVGNDFRERERIRRKVNRWCSRMREQPESDRIALLSAMAADPIFQPAGGVPSLYRTLPGRRRPSTEAAL